MTISFRTSCLHALEKVFPDEPLTAQELKEGSALLNETFSFQIAYCCDRKINKVHIQIQSELLPFVLLQYVGLVPSEYQVPHDHDGDILRSTPGLYPDPLYPYNLEEGVIVLPEQWRSVWITIDPASSILPGTYPIHIRFVQCDGVILGQTKFSLKIIDACLPEQKLVYTNWLHADCLATHYGVDVFSEQHWKILNRFVETAAKHGMNAILTPVFTPPLDTEVGRERPTVQLVNVIKEEKTYHFRFELLDRWIRMCKGKGIKYFEISHLFTQWGAKHAPKVMAEVNGEQQRIFGWETDAFGAEYRSFVSQFLPELVGFLRHVGVGSQVYFHVSDEPSLEHLENYRNASAIIGKYVKDLPVIDALSNYEFYAQGIVKRPIPANDHIEMFLEGNVPNLWTYYCWAQYKGVSNRYIAMPSYRNRVLGYQLYKFQIEGFLHWGYNFWNSGLSRRSLNPFLSTDAGRDLPSGDAFVVYPSEQGEPIESIRLKVFHDALQDLRALLLLEERIGRESVLTLLEEGLDQPLTFEQYPRSGEWLIKTRERINEAIMIHCETPHLLDENVRKIMPIIKPSKR